MPRYCPRCGEPLHTHSTTKGRARKGAPVGSRLAYDDTQQEKKKRKPSRYNKVYGRHYSRLKKKHPRTSFGELSKKAHKATKRELK